MTFSAASRPPRRLRAALGRFAASRLSSVARDDRGVSAIEFALILPILITLFIGGNELGQAVSMYRKASHSGSVIGDLITQTSSVATGGDMDNMFNAALAIMLPFPQSGLKIVVAQVTMDASGSPKVTWRDSKNGGDEASWSCGSPPPSRIDIPAAMKVANTSLIITEVEYEWKSNFSAISRDLFGTDTIKLKDVAMLRPRMSETIPYADNSRNCS